MECDERINLDAAVSPRGGAGGSSAGSASHKEKRSKRGKYVSKACLECRRRKLKCSGEEPCQRCARYGKSCLFSEDHAAAEILRNMNRIGRPRVYGLPSAGEGSVTPDRGEEPSPMTLEERMMRLEAKVEMIAAGKTAKSARSSMEPEPEQGAPDASDFRGGPSFRADTDTFSANLATVKRQLGIEIASARSSSLGTSTSPSVTGPSVSSPPAAIPFSSPISMPAYTKHVGSRTLPFPSPADYVQYIEFFFEDVNPCHPCVNERDFRARSERLLASHNIDHSDMCFLALNYIIFSLGDILQDISPIGEPKSHLAGWQWYLAADDLMGKRQVSGRGDLSLIQFTMFEALYLVHADKPNAAYNVAGLACRLCFQFGLHQQSRWGPDCSPYLIHMRQRVLWTVYYLDRRVSLSCGRPYGMRDLDIDVDLPDWLDDRELVPGRPLPRQSPDRSSNVYLTCMVAFARLAGDLWDELFSAKGVRDSSAERIYVIDTRITQWCDSMLPTLPLLPQLGEPTRRHYRQQLLITTRFAYLRLLLRRRMLVSLNYDRNTGQICGDLNVDIVRQLRKHADEISSPSSFRFHMAVTLGGAILFLATLLARDLSQIGLQDRRPIYAESFNIAVSMLRDLTKYLEFARRIAYDLQDIVHVVEMLLNKSETQTQAEFANFMPTNLDALFPYAMLDFATQPSDGPGSGIFPPDAINSLDWS